MTDLATIVSRFNNIIGGGGSVEFVRVEAAQVMVRYIAGSEDCEVCVLTQGDLAALILEAVQRSDSSVREVTLI